MAMGAIANDGRLLEPVAGEARHRRHRRHALRRARRTFGATPFRRSIAHMMTRDAGRRSPRARAPASRRRSPASAWPARRRRRRRSIRRRASTPTRITWRRSSASSRPSGRGWSSRSCSTSRWAARTPADRSPRPVFRRVGEMALRYLGVTPRGSTPDEALRRLERARTATRRRTPIDVLGEARRRRGRRRPPS